MESKGFRQGSVITAAIGLLVWLGAGLAGAAETHRFANGITVNIYTPEEIAEQWTTLEKDGTYLIHPAISPVELSANTAGMYPFGENFPGAVCVLQHHVQGGRVDSPQIKVPLPALRMAVNKGPGENMAHLVNGDVSHGGRIRRTSQRRQEDGVSTGKTATSFGRN